MKSSRRSRESLKTRGRTRNKAIWVRCTASEMKQRSRGSTFFFFFFLLSSSRQSVPFTCLSHSCRYSLSFSLRVSRCAAFSLLSFYARFSRAPVSPLIVAPDFDGWHVRFPPRSLVSPLGPPYERTLAAPFISLLTSLFLSLSLSPLFPCLFASVSRPSLLNACPSRGRYQHLPFVSCLPWCAPSHTSNIEIENVDSLNEPGRYGRPTDLPAGLLRPATAVYRLIKRH